MNPRLFSFLAGPHGAWRITRISSVVGEILPPAPYLELVAGEVAHPAASTPPFLPAPADAGWRLRGVVSNERYVTRDEKTELVAKQEGLGRAEASCAALIPIRKNAAWWAMTQDERRRLFEEQSKHIRIGLPFLPAIARRLHHCRDLPTPEPFDFLTWFEYAPADAPAFEELVRQLRATPEWTYVEREVDVRLERVV